MPSRTIVLLTVFKNIKPLTFEILETWRVGEAQQVAAGKYRLTISKGIGGMDVTLDDIVVHQQITPDPYRSPKWLLTDCFRRSAGSSRSLLESFRLLVGDVFLDVFAFPLPRNYIRGKRWSLSPINNNLFQNPEVFSDFLQVFPPLPFVLILGNTKRQHERKRCAHLFWVMSIGMGCILPNPCRNHKLWHSPERQLRSGGYFAADLVCKSRRDENSLW